MARPAVSVGLLLLAASFLLANASSIPGGEYDSELATRALFLSSAAYCEQTVMTWSCAICAKVPGVVPVKVFNGIADVFGVALVDTVQKRFVIAFRGSEQLDNWLLDFEAIREDYPPIEGAEVHSGFYQGWRSVQTEVLETFAAMRTKYGNYPVLATGHSLGAAIGFWAGVELSKLYSVTIYTFGQPRLGNLEFSQGAVQNVTAGPFRVVHHQDPVPHLPTRYIPFNVFHHARTEIWYNEANTNYTVCDNSGEDPKCSNSELDLEGNDHTFYMGFNLPAPECK